MGLSIPKENLQHEYKIYNLNYFIKLIKWLIYTEKQCVYDSNSQQKYASDSRRVSGGGGEGLVWPLR